MATWRGCWCRHGYGSGSVGAIEVPTLVIHGTEDAILPLDHGMVLADNIPNAKSYIMEGVGHEIPEQLLLEITTEMVTLFKQTNDY